MATVVFDFDSTLIRCESLEEIVGERLARMPSVAARYREITVLGMSGGWSFHDSLTARLAIAAPSRADVARFVERVDTLWTPEIPDVVRELTAEGHDVWVVSGAFRDALVPSVARLGIPRERVLGVGVEWTDTGEYLSLRDDDPFAHSKVAGVAQAAPEWLPPVVMVGDGATDRALYDEGLVDRLIPFTLHVRRPAAIPPGIPEADSVKALRRLLKGYLAP